jgi:hypothetical protein
MTELKPQTPGGYVIFCDDIRQEINGKLIYTGVYGGNMLIAGAPPATLPKLGFSIHYRERPGESDEPVKLQLFYPGVSFDDEPSMEAEIPVEGMRVQPLPSDPDADDPQVGIVMQFQVSPFEVKQEGRIRVRAVRGDTIIRLGSLMLQFVPNF